MNYRKKLIEVALPLEDINREAAWEKSIRHGHPSTLHLWWARRPLAACRAVLFASLVDDPSECVAELMVDKAKRKAADGELRKRQKLWADATALMKKAQAAGISAPEPGPEPKIEAILVETERERLFDIIRALVKWDNSSNERVLDAARAEIMRSCSGNPPPVYDPFCGGGSIPLEAQRLGLEAHGSDLNPVPVLITKALVEIPSKFAGSPPVHPEPRERTRYERTEGLAEDIRYYGSWMRDQAQLRIGNLYPKVKLPKEHGGGEATVIAWLWARTVASPNPAARGAHVPLIRSFWLSTKKGGKAWLHQVVDSERMTYRFEIRTGEPPDADFVNSGTKAARANFRCILTGTAISGSYLKTEGKAGRLGTKLLAIVAEGNRGRIYVPADAEHERLANEVVPPWSPEGIISDDKRSMFTPLYGLTDFKHLFTPRQLTALATFSDLIKEARVRVELDARAAGQTAEMASERSDAIATYLSFALSKMADRGSTICTWFTERDSTRNTFARQAIPMTWDYAELNTLLTGTGSFEGAVSWTVESLEGIVPAKKRGLVKQISATAISPPHPVVFSTDPPYYDNIGYADLSDFFYVWLRRSLSEVFPDLFGTMLVPKAEELVAAPHRFEGDKERAKEFFEEGLSKVFERMLAHCHPEFPTTIFYAFKQSEDTPEDGLENANGGNLSRASTGWETMLAGLIRTGWQVDGTWPVRTELANKITMGTNILASSIVLVCRPRSKTAAVASRRDFLAAVKRELPDALRNLQKGNIAPVDLAQAAIGPGMAVFSRYAKVLETDGTPMSVRTALAVINQSLDEVLAEQEGEFDADTRWALAWFDQNGFNEGSYGIAETLCTAKNTSVSGMVEAGILTAKGGKVRLLRRDELSANWNPANEKRLTIWECTHQLIRALDAGEEKAADLLKKLGALAEAARDLSYRLYSICERRKWAQEAMGYNALVQSWSDVKRVSDEQTQPAQPVQQEFL